jgi:predicted nucleic acid-binding protein
MTDVVDSTVLIYLSKIDVLRLLDELFEEVLVPEAVHEEVIVSGLEQRYSDALAVDEANFLSVRDVENDDIEYLQQSANLGLGESEAITLARMEDCHCLTDDHAARKTAESFGVNVGGTVYVLLAALKDNIIDFNGYEGALSDLADTDFRMKASLYKKALDEGRNYK